MRRLCAVLCLFVWVVPVLATTVAQTVAPTLQATDTIRARFTTTNATPLIGIPTELRLVVEVPADAVVTMPQFPTDWPPFMVQNVSEVTVTNYGATALHEQVLTVMLWRPGDHATPETIVTYTQPTAATPITLVTQPAFFSVPSVVSDSDLNLRPFDPPISLPYVSPLLIAGVIGAAAVATGVLLWWRPWQTGARPRRANSSKEPRTAAQAALAQLRRMQADNVPPIVAYPLVADCLRTYIEKRIEVQARDLTTDELLDGLEKRGHFTEKQLTSLGNVLDWADLVKFARVEPGSRSVERLIEAATGWVEGAEAAVSAREAVERAVTIQMPETPKTQPIPKVRRGSKAT